MVVAKLSGPLFLIALLAVWETAAQAELTNPLLVPSVSRILTVFWNAVSSGQIPCRFCSV
jgi:ABC-type nitrate/sulfonate/bicarbonate transport system permease component